MILPGQTRAGVVSPRTLKYISKEKKLKRLVGVKRYDPVPIDKLDTLSD
jgi:hypothetical protein